MKKEKNLLHIATNSLIVVIVLFYILCIIMAISSIVLLVLTDSRDTFSTIGEIFLIIFSVILAIAYVPAIYAVKYGQKYLTDENYETLEKCSKWGFITLAVTLIITKMIGILLSAILYIPIIIYLMGWHKEREKLLKKSKKTEE